MVEDNTGIRKAGRRGFGKELIWSVSFEMPIMYTSGGLC